jgi:hypothetical protein
MIEIRTPAAPVETVTPIKPSEAIRLGCLLAPVQAFGDYTYQPGSACAMKAMYLAYGEPTDDDEDDGTDWAFDNADAGAAFEAVAMLPCPVGCPEDFEDVTPAHLNDSHRWSRERIADWLEGLGL